MKVLKEYCIRLRKSKIEKKKMKISGSEIGESKRRKHVVMSGAKRGMTGGTPSHPLAK